MELFQFVNIETLAPEASEEAVRTRVTVIEGKHQRFNWGAGYGTEEKARTEGEYRHVNFLGGARSAGVRGRWSSLDRGVRFDLLQPYLFSPRVSLLTDAQQWWTYTPAYRSVLTGGRAIVTRRPSDTTSWSVSVTGETNSSTISDETLRDPRLFDDLIALGLDPTTGRQEGTFTAIGFDYQRSTADSLLDARTGYQLAFQVEHAATWLPGSFSYSAVSSDVRHYLPVGSRLVVANRAQMGAILPANDDQANVPFSKKYFLGGATTIRGWGRFEVSPLLDGVPVGGTSLFAMTSELRAQVTRSAGAVLFFDAGNVWDEARRFRFDELRYSAGVGLRYRTPVGPIRFDVGYQLTTIPDLRVDGQPQARPWRLHFSIGQAF
jgi:outer membrane protein insertion porin family/translocation and assembly module TamA